MTRPYARVIPRDLFNEADLLKCLGRLWIELDNRGADFGPMLYQTDDGPFRITQDESDGSIFVENVVLKVRGRVAHLSRPLNARRSWPIWLTFPDDPDFDAIRVFTEEGLLTPDFMDAVGIPR